MNYLYNRSLHPDDYKKLTPWHEGLNSFESSLQQRSITYRKDHQHREWEYSNVLRQLDELSSVNPSLTKILDTGSGASYLPLYLKTLGYDITVNDSGAYGDITDMLVHQCLRLGIEIPLNKDEVESLVSIPSETFDVTMCISVIEHVAANRYEQALHTLCRVTKPGGYLFLTSDYFDDPNKKTPYDSIQHTKFTEDRVKEIPKIIPVEFVGGTFLAYRGDFVNNYSFCNMCFRKFIESEVSDKWPEDEKE